MKSARAAQQSLREVTHSDENEPRQSFSPAVKDPMPENNLVVIARWGVFSAIKMAVMAALYKAMITQAAWSQGVAAWRPWTNTAFIMAGTFIVHEVMYLGALRSAIPVVNPCYHELLWRPRRELPVRAGDQAEVV